MPIKTWNLEAENIVYDKVELWMNENGLLHVRRGYRFIDIEGHEVLRFNNTPWSYEEVIEWAHVPADIQNALIFIDNYTKGKINTAEGIS